jgi:predicted permease
MSFFSRISNVLRGDRLSREIDEELQSHLAEAIEHGRDPAEARRAFGSAMRLREESRDVRLIAWLDSLRADAVFGWRQIMKKKVTSAAAILSLALGTGACTAAFRLIDALLLRPLPVAHPERLYSVFHQSIGEDTYEYPLFRRMRAAVKGQAEVIAVSTVLPVDLTYGSDQDTEKAWLQFVSGWMFGSFGLRPALGRLFTENDDLTPHAHPYAVLSHDYWTRRFNRDPKVIGRTFRIGKDLFEIMGVAPAPFTGTQTGTVTDLFVPTMMHPGVTTYAGWIHTLVRLNAGVAMEPIRDRLRVPFRAFHMETAKGFKGMPKQRIDEYLGETLFLEPAAAGVSRMQRHYRQSLVALGVLVALVLLIACANVANLMTAQAAARSREMALRVSIGAGQWRLVQMVLVESVWLACLASIIGGALAWWAAPFVVARINPPQYPARLSLPADWRVLAFAVAVTLAVTFLFGLAPALRAWAVKPASALKGGDDPHSRRSLMHMLIAVQVAFCFLVLFVGSLFVATFRRLSSEPTGFSADRLLTLDTIAPADQPPAFWNQVVEHLRTVPGVETVALAGWPLLDGYVSIGGISVDGAPPTKDRSYFMSVSPGWFEAMKIPLTEGRDFRAGDPEPGVAVVNHAFAKRYFNGENPLGKFFENTEERLRFQIVGLVGDARYLDVRGPWVPVAYVPFQARRSANLVVRTSSANPLALAPVLRREVARARPGFRVSNIRTQADLVRAQTVRERLLAMLALFFAGVALLLAGIGLYGVLDYGVLQRRREIGIRIAIGAQAGDIARRVTVDIFSMVLVGAVAGVAAGLASVRYVETLLYQVKATDVTILAAPSFTILAAAFLSALPAVIRAVRIDPAETLRAE